MPPKKSASKGDERLNFALDLGEHGVPLLSVAKTKWQRVVTTLHHVSGDVQGLCHLLQRTLGTGGRVRGSVIELMGDQREKVLVWLLRAGLVRGSDQDQNEEQGNDDTAVKARAKPRWTAEKRHAAVGADDGAGSSSDPAEKEAAVTIPGLEGYDGATPEVSEGGY